MPGGNKNINGSDGKQFSKDYQPQEKWTEKRALEVGNELLEWLKAEDDNLFFEEFLYLENDYYTELIAYLSKKFSSFLRLIEKAKKIQEIKLYKYGAFDKLNSQITKFVLINEHGKTSEKTENKTENTNKDNIVIVTDKEAREELNKFLDESN